MGDMADLARWSDDEYGDEWEYERRLADRKVWTTREGVRVRIKDMSDSHLINTEAYLRRRNINEEWPQYEVMLKQIKKRGLEMKVLEEICNENS